MANDLFEKGQYVDSAMHFAKTKCGSFETVALKFMQVFIYATINVRNVLSIHVYF